ncbi:hypothetical protein HZU77_004425 [Neisseriaceae bacterium TC5R-5]|nr:hypothetical protein [Neisseriaceae bacterium TC5R-5]
MLSAQTCLRGISLLVRSTLMLTVLAASSGYVNAARCGEVGPPGTMVGPVLGYIDNIYKNADGSVMVAGWSCNKYVDQSISVQLYTGSQFIAMSTANVLREKAVNDTCCTTDGVRHGFAFNVGKNMGGKPIKVFGLASGWSTQLENAFWINPVIPY